VLVSHLNLLDGAFTFFLMACVSSFVLAQRERRWMLVAWVAAALAVLSKGIVALVLTGTTLVLYSLTTRDWKPWRRLHVWLGLPLFLAITVPWFWIVSKRNPEFLQFFFVHEHFQRFLTTVHERAGPWWYFAPFVLLMVLPWVTRVWPVIRDAWRVDSVALAPSGFRAERFLLLWCGVTLVFFSLSGSKLAPYILPMAPPLAVLIGARIADDAKAMRTATWIIAALVVAVAAALIIANRGSGPHEMALLGWAVIAMLIAVAAVALHRQTVSAPLAPLALASLLAWQALMLAYAERQPLRTAKPLVAAVRPDIHPGTQLFSVAQYRQTIPVYLQRTLRLVSFQGELELDLPQQNNVGYISSLADFRREWDRTNDAVAFIEPSVYTKLQSEGFAARVLASDGRTIAVARP
jgi:4-amino-4-deoxy-L-arabinose transferase-like glycosyltransferase